MKTITWSRYILRFLVWKWWLRSSATRSPRSSWWIRKTIISEIAIMRFSQSICTARRYGDVDDKALLHWSSLSSGCKHSWNMLNWWTKSFSSNTIMSKRLASTFAGILRLIVVEINLLYSNLRKTISASIYVYIVVVDGWHHVARSRKTYKMMSKYSDNNCEINIR